jgi:hypothetical protein
MEDETAFAKKVKDQVIRCSYWKKTHISSTAFIQIMYMSAGMPMKVDGIMQKSIILCILNMAQFYVFGRNWA